MERNVVFSFLRWRSVVMLGPQESASLRFPCPYLQPVSRPSGLTLVPLRLRRASKANASSIARQTLYDKGDALPDGRVHAPLTAAINLRPPLQSGLLNHPGLLQTRVGFPTTGFGAPIGMGAGPECHYVVVPTQSPLGTHGRDDSELYSSVFFFF